MEESDEDWKDGEDVWDDNSGKRPLVLNESEGDGENEDVFRFIAEITEEEIRRLEFRSLDEACEFYKNYAMFHGFVTRKHVRKVDRVTRAIVMQELVCNREGKREQKYIDRVDRVRVHRDETRTNCEAKIRFRFDNLKQKWLVTSFVGEHKHMMTAATQMHFHPKCRGLTAADKAQVDSMIDQGVRPCQIMGYLMAQKGDHASAGFIKRDLYNYIWERNNALIEEGDAGATLSYFDEKCESDPYHFAMCTRDEDGRILNLFWTDGCSRTDYGCFGDVIAFDSTYKRNKYKLPVVILSGYNNHAQTVVFGCAILNDEKTESYKWLLEVFLKAMYGKHPAAVVTDGDGAMRDAIKSVFPEAHHRLCAWHLHRNAVENVKNAAFLKDFVRAIYENFNTDEFEKYWEEMKKKHGLMTNKWVASIYEKKKQWATAYMRDIFFAGIRTTSICEGVNNFINKYVKRTNSLIQFVVNFERAVKEYRHNELAADFNSNMTFPVLTTSLTEVEECAAKTFTRKIFGEVQKQIRGAGGQQVEGTVVSGDVVTMKVVRSGSPLNGVEVTYDKGENKFLCACRLYEIRGIPCEHILCVLKHAHITYIPSSLIMKRWTNNAKSEHIVATTAEKNEAHNAKVIRFAALSAGFNMLCKLGAENSNDFMELQNEISRLTSAFLKRAEERSKHGSVAKIIGDPNYVKTKGAPKKAQKKGWRKRKCSGCGRSGHYIRTCPKLRLTVEVNSQGSGSSSDEEYAMENDNHDVMVLGCDGEVKEGNFNAVEEQESGSCQQLPNASMGSSIMDVGSSALELLERVQHPNWGK